MNSVILTLSKDSRLFQLTYNSGLTNADLRSEKDLKPRLIDQIVRNSNDHANSFQHLPIGLKICVFAAFFISSFFTNLVLNILLLSAALISFSILRGFNGFNGQGGFLHDIVNFFPYVGKLKKDWIEDDPKRLNTMIIGSLAIVCAIYPAALYLSEDFLKKAEDYGKYTNLIKSFVMILQGFFFTLLAVLFGMALNYFINIFLKTRLTKDEYDLMKDQTKYSKPAKTELITRLIVASLGVIVSVVGAYLKPKILAQISTANPFYPYISVLITSIVILLGIQCLSTRIMIPIVRKLMLKCARENDGKGKRKKRNIIFLAFMFYFLSIVFFSLNTYFDKLKFFQNVIVNNVILASFTGLGISCNILGCLFIYMMTMLLIDSRALSTKLLSDIERDKNEAKSDIRRNKIIGAIILIGAVVSITSIAALLIYSEINHLKYMDFFISRPYLTIIYSFLLSVMIFSGIAFYGKTSIIEKSVGLIEKFGGVEEIQKLMNEAQRVYSMNDKIESYDVKSKLQISQIFKVVQNDVTLQIQFS